MRASGRQNVNALRDAAEVSALDSQSFAHCSAPAHGHRCGGWDGGRYPPVQHCTKGQCAACGHCQPVGMLCATLSVTEVVDHLNRHPAGTCAAALNKMLLA
jgi:hypothetical protein